MRLTVETGPLAGTVVNLERDAPTLLGSGADCGLRIQEVGVSEHHAVVKALKGTGFGIKAQGKVRVNGSNVQASPLADGDVIEIGTTRIAFGKTQEQGLPAIPGYRIIDILGKGGMGTVYRAEQVSLHREIALKVLRQSQTTDPKFVANFVAEARAAAKLQHPNVVAVFDVEHDGDTYYYAMELMHEGSCEDWLKQNGIMPIDRALQVIADAAAGLAYAESLGIVHRDIKPDNLMLDQHGAIKIADLGLASSGAEASTERAVGTPHFMAPEQVLNKEVDHRTDLYALGCTFYRLITGKTPFRGQTVKDILRAQVKDQAEPASKINPRVSPDVAAMVQRLMAKEPGNRYQTANELLEELDAMLQPPQKRGLWIALATTAVLIASGAIYYAVNKPTETEIVEKVKVFDDPLTQEFADRIKVLEGEAKEKDAAIAFLTTRLSGNQGDALATALEEIATAHSNTAAAVQASELAKGIRRTVAEEKAKLAQRRGRIAEHVASLRQAAIKPLDALDFELAMRVLDTKARADLEGDEELSAAVNKLRADVIDKARSRIQELRDPVATAIIGADETKLAAAIQALDLGLQPDTRWPLAMQTEVADAKTEGQTARQVLASIQQTRKAGVWVAYHDLLKASDGFSSHINHCDFVAATACVATFANNDPSNEAAARAKGIASWSRHADEFSKALEQACKTGDLQINLGEGRIQIVGWDRTKHEFATKNVTRRRKSEPLTHDDLTIEQWVILASQVEGTPSGSRECFLGLIAVDRHCHEAAAYLGQLNTTSDDTGTKDQAYGLSTESFEALLQTLPRTSVDCSDVVCDELQACKRLASGLRALSENRNIAAAGHIEKLLADHPHSWVVAVLP